MWSSVQGLGLRAIKRAPTISRVGFGRAIYPLEGDAVTKGSSALVIARISAAEIAQPLSHETTQNHLPNKEPYERTAYSDYSGLNG